VVDRAPVPRSKSSLQGGKFLSRLQFAADRADMESAPKARFDKKTKPQNLSEIQHLPRYRALRSIKERGSPLPCSCRISAILRCYAVPSEPLFSYLTRLRLCFLSAAVRARDPPRLLNF